MRRTTSGTSARMGLQFTPIQEASVTSETRIHDAEGVVVTVGDEIEMAVLSEPTGVPAQGSARYARVVEVRTTSTVHKPAAVVVCWKDNQRVGALDPIVFENFCRVLVSVAGMKTPAAAVAGTDVEVDEPVRDRSGSLIRVGDDVRFVYDYDETREEQGDRGRVIEVKGGTLLVAWNDGSETAIPVAIVPSNIQLVMSRS